MDGWLQAVISIAALGVGFGLKTLYDELRVPSLEILKSSGPFDVERPPGAAWRVNATDLKAYRVMVRNKQKRLLNMAAENCVAWLELDSAPEAYQLSWVGGSESVTINVGDSREIDLCARDVDYGTIIAPTEKGYLGTEGGPRKIGDGTEVLSGTLRITSRNGKKAERRVEIGLSKEPFGAFFKYFLDITISHKK